MRTFEPSKTDKHIKRRYAMKTLLNSLLVAVTLTLISFSVSQAEINKPIGRPKKAATFQSAMYTTTEGKVQIALNKEIGGAVTVRLTNHSGKDFFVQQIGKRQHSVRLRLDVSGLPDGIYQVAISNGSETTVQELTLATHQPSMANRLVVVN